MQQEKYGRLLALNYNLFDLNDYDQIIDYIVNDSHKIIPYQLAVVYEIQTNKTDKAAIVNISGTLGQDLNVNFKNWLIDTINYLHERFISKGFEQELKDSESSESSELSKSSKMNLKVLHPQDLDEKITKIWAGHLGQELVISNIYKSKNKELYLITFNDQSYEQDSLINYNFIVKSYQQSLKINLMDTSSKGFTGKSKIYWFKMAIICFIVALFLPITPNVLAPAEIISEQTMDINAPVDGVIEEVNIDPNTSVKSEQILFNFDQIDLRNNLRIKQQELKTLETEIGQAQAEGFEDKEQRAKLFRLQQQLATKKQEIQYSKEKLDLSVVRSPADGMVLFKDKNDLIGKPVKIGESIMRVVNLDSSIIEIWLDVNDSMKLKKGMDVYYYSNSAPFRARAAKLNYFSYEAYITPQGNIAFRLLAKLDNQQSELIVGDHGKVKIYGSKKIFLGQFIFQKPIASLRQWFYGTI